MRIVTLLPVSFFLTTLLSITGAVLKIMHAPGADSLLVAAMAFNILFVILAIIEVRRSQRIPFHEKTMWTVGFILFSGIAGLVYLLMGRRRVMNP
jgi:hypothetical protein